MKRKTTLALLALALSGWSAGDLAAQTYSPPKLNYGYQPYDDRNPTGFNHPNDMGFGNYVYSPKLKGHRASALSYRRFKGY